MLCHGYILDKLSDTFVVSTRLKLLKSLYYKIKVINQ